MKLNEIVWEDGKKYKENLHGDTYMVKEAILAYGFYLVGVETGEHIEDIFFTNQLVKVDFEEVE